MVFSTKGGANKKQERRKERMTHMQAHHVSNSVQQHVYVVVE